MTPECLSVPLMLFGKILSESRVFLSLCVASLLTLAFHFEISINTQSSLWMVLSNATRVWEVCLMLLYGGILWSLMPVPATDRSFRPLQNCPSYLWKPILTRAIDDFCQPPDRWSTEKSMQSPKSKLLNKHFEVTTADDYDFLISGTMDDMCHW